MNIVYASDDNYAEIAEISMLSLFENNREMKEINVFLLESMISEQNKQKLMELADLYERNIYIIKMPDIEKIAGQSLHIFNHITLPAFARLFIARILPENIDKVLYLDCDVMIRGSLESFWNEDLEGYMLCGVLAAGFGRGNKARIFLRKNDIYANTGVLLINLKKWRDCDVEEKFTKFIAFFDGRVPVEDQGVINGVLSRHIKLVHPKYNYSYKYHDDSYERLRNIMGKPLYSSKILDEAKNDPVIFHFLDIYKPFEKEYDGLYKEEFLQYKSMSAWADSPLRETEILQRLKCKRENDKKILKAKIKKMLRPLYIFWFMIRQWPYRKRIEKYCGNEGYSAERL